MGAIHLLPVAGIGEIKAGDDLAGLCVEAFADFRDNDILVVSSKVVSKAEGNVVPESSLSPSPFAQHLAQLTGSSPQYCELVLRESAGILRMAKGVVICRTHHGFVMANAGVDASNTGGEGLLIPLPKDPDESARKIGQQIHALTGKHVGIVISDTFGRAWRVGQMDLAIGVWGISPLRDYRGHPDDDGRMMHKTCIAAADELAAAAELASGKTDRVPAVVVRGYQCSGSGSAKELLMNPAMDLFP
ncbi:MAG: coenzyme F420-0:L-glutamate ligase [Oscillospiraceae bacterium]|jgi:coenzyme F420-0:L-glutamate ligase/coenzyme F420-1:gamma-L-glutamate ligase